MEKIAADIENQTDTDRKLFIFQEKLIAANKFINQQAEEIEHLKKLLNDAIPSSSVLLPTDEEVIADTQLARLKTAALERTLSLDECRALDLLVKTKRIAKDAASEIIDHKGLPKTLTQNELVKIAVRKPKA
jgi:hypothetical protein